MSSPDPKYVEDIYPKLIPKQCEICESTTSLSRCSACRVYYYCSRDHQLQDRPKHKSTCKTLSAHCKAADDIKAKLLARDPDIFTSDRAGNLNFLLEGRLWLRARHAYAEMLVRSWHRQGIEDALAVWQDILKHDRRDRQWVRDGIPGLLVRLGRDQEAYDFCAWYQTVDSGRFQWNDANVPMLTLHDADVLQSVEPWTREGGLFMNLSGAATVALIKMRLMGALQDALLLKKGRPDLSPDAVMAAVKESNPGDILEKHPEWLADEETIREKLEKLAEGMEGLFNAIGKYNKHYWKMVFHPTEKELESMPGPMSAGSWDEALHVLFNTYSAWVESPMVIPALRAMVETAQRNATASS